jgi:hypothetical protein
METIGTIKEKMKWEKDLYELNINWFDCIIMRMRWHLNWYVHIDFLLLEEQKIELDVHWGITFSWDIGRLSIPLLTKEYPNKIIWFDTAHAWDAFLDTSLPESYQHIWWEYRDYEYIECELEELTLQLTKLKWLN